MKILMIIMFLIANISYAIDEEFHTQNLRYEKVLIQNFNNENKMNVPVMFALAYTANEILDNLGITTRICIIFTKMPGIAYVDPAPTYRIYISEKYRTSYYMLQIIPHEIYHVYQMDTDIKRVILDLIKKKNKFNQNDDGYYLESTTEIEAIQYSKDTRSDTFTTFIKALRDHRNYDYLYNESVTRSP